MNARIAAALAVSLFVAGVGVGYAAQKKIGASLYHDKPQPEAAKALLDVARAQAGDGSWERIAIGRIYYLGGFKSEGQAVFDEVLGEEHDPSDEFRIARVYREAGEWAMAKARFDRYITEHRADEKELAEIGAYYLLNGDRATAERLFDRSFAIGPELWATLSAAGAYLGVAPQG